MKASLCIDDAVGERRRCLLDASGRPFRLDFDRWSERGRRAKLDEIWWGRARARMAGRGWFVDLGLGEDGVLETKAAITEGALIPVRVKSEAWTGKGPVLSMADMPASVARPARPGLHTAPAPDPFLADVELIETVDPARSRREIDNAIEEATSLRADVQGGGELIIERTGTLTTIDVDMASRGAPDVELNLAAADEAARQIALRGIGGLLVVDFVSMPAAGHRKRVAECFRSALAERLGRASKVLEISALGLCEAAVARRGRSVADAMLAVSPAEREALHAIRLMEEEAPGHARIEAVVSSEAKDWLDRDAVGWRQALADRIGSRLEISGVDRPPGQPSVRGRGG